MNNHPATAADPCAEATELFLRLPEEEQEMMLDLLRSLLTDQAQAPSAIPPTD